MEDHEKSELEAETERRVKDMFILHEAALAAMADWPEGEVSGEPQPQQRSGPAPHHQ